VQSNRKIREGKVTSNKMDKTAVVAVERFMKHPLYAKVIRVLKKYKVHDEENRCKVGDKVKIIETRPMSCGKRWRVELK